MKKNILPLRRKEKRQKMAVIALEGMRFWAFHGYYEEERILGGWFTVDVFVTTNTNAAAADDDLYKTVNYEVVFLAVKYEMAKSVQLIETLAANIVTSLKNKFDGMQALKVQITKHQPPLGGQVDKAVITLEESFVKTCGKCGASLFCYADKTCFCFQIRIAPETLRLLRQQYKGCLCKNCLKKYALPSPR